MSPMKPQPKSNIQQNQAALRARSELMAKIKSRNTKPELVVRRALHAAGLRYRLHDARLPGRPDIVLPSRRLIVEVRGCWWHGHACQVGRLPKARTEYWLPKLARNAVRDQENEAALRKLGWRLIVVWECELRRNGPKDVVDAVLKLPQVAPADTPRRSMSLSHPSR